LGYRKEVVMKNLNIAFPDKTEKEKIRIAKDFYHSFIDTFIETVKLISISKKEFLRRIDFDESLLQELSGKEQSIQMHSGHFFNYEFMNFVGALYLKNNWLGIYAPMSNKAINKIMFDMRAKFGTILISNKEFKSKFHLYSSKPYTLGLAADQSPHNPNNAFWVDFFGKKTAFVKGPEKGSKNQNTAVIMVYIHKTKRGYYKVETTLLTTTPNETPNGFITKALVNFIEEKIKQHPANYLWSHKRWKHEYDAEKYGHLVID
jgi:KDO2-lipid IV(A) lauroyltransferase